MNLTYDRQITISVGNSRRDLNWKRQSLKVSELYERLHVLVRSDETLDEYMRMSKAKQDDLKDIGGFVGGVLNGPQRKGNAVISRDLITLDLDNISANGTDGIITTLDKMGISYAVYSTRKHAPNKPRLRIVVPTDRTMSPDEYEPCARRMAADIGISMADPTTFEVNRLFYWFSACADTQTVFKTVDAPMISADWLLSRYADWHDVTQWPQVPGSFNYPKLAVKQGDPLTKPGIVGAFCRRYDIVRAMTDLLPGIYAPCDTDPNRYTYTAGSTTGGAVVYDDGKFLYSHHATDPCSNKLVNAFDLVRLHKYGDQDDSAADGTPNNRLPSYKAMCEYANSLDEVALEMLKTRQEQAAEEFAGLINSTGAGAGGPGSVTISTGIGAGGNSGNGGTATPGAEGNWQLLLARNKQTGEIKCTRGNILLIMTNDPRIRGRAGINLFTQRFEVTKRLPWMENDADYVSGQLWRDCDESYLGDWLQRCWGMTSIIEKELQAAVQMTADKQKFDSVREELKNSHWDGVSRLETYIIDYLGAKDTSYNRAVSAKMLLASVTRAFDPGHKFDNMLILSGPQGIGKSTLLRKLSKNRFCDSLEKFEGKEDADLLRGVCIVEVSELKALSRSETAAVKQFLSQTMDRFRPAYGRNVVEYKRRCVFFGTTNDTEYLQDLTGNRRFWPVEVGVQPAKKSVFTDLTDYEIDQIWAEAYVRFVCGEGLLLSPDIEKEAVQQQKDKTERGMEVGLIQDFIDRNVPDDWDKWPIPRRLDFWEGAIKTEGLNLVPRKSICAVEVWRELYKNPIRGSIPRKESNIINSVIKETPGFVPYNGRYPWYGVQRGYVRKG